MSTLPMGQDGSGYATLSEHHLYDLMNEETAPSGEEGELGKDLPIAYSFTWPRRHKEHRRLFLQQVHLREIRILFPPIEKRGRSAQIRSKILIRR